MRLINTSTLQLDEFFGDEIPSYAILSHTWTKEEVTLQEWQTSKQPTKTKVGYKKVRDACNIAKELGYEWLWADTVCIDKTSSADLSEAINSMYVWYCESAECLAYLVDIDIEYLANEKRLKDFATSRWFTRGWTLQELVAPNRLTFYDTKWKRIGTKSKYERVIEANTGIDSGCIHLQKIDRRKIPIARRMSWFAGRQTRRIEDMAYCMMGIFDINMPLLYGEGKKAYIRLQHEILRQENDHSIFAWVCDPPLLSVGVLAPSPAAFADSDFRAMFTFRLKKPVPYSITNLGLSVRLPSYRTFHKVFACLEAWDGDSLGRHSSNWGILLERRSDRTLVRAMRPNRPLKLCANLWFPSMSDMFLSIEPAVNPDELPPDASELRFQLPGRAPCGKYALFLLFDDTADKDFREASAHPGYCLYETESLLTFPDHDETWIEKTAEVDDQLLRVRSTATVLCNSSHTGLCDPLDICILFTLSIITKEKAGEVVLMDVVFGKGTRILQRRDDIVTKYEKRPWYELQLSFSQSFVKHSPGDGLQDHFHTDEHWQMRRDSRPMKLLEQETQQVLDKAAALGHWDIGDLDRSKFQETVSLVTVGCCDAKYPGFEEVRMVYITSPPDSASRPTSD